MGRWRRNRSSLTTNGAAPAKVGNGRRVGMDSQIDTLTRVRARIDPASMARKLPNQLQTWVSMVNWVRFRFCGSGLMTLAAKITSPRTYSVDGC